MMKGYRRNVLLALLLVLTSMLCSCAHQAGNVETIPGAVKDWNGLIDEVQVVSPFNLNDYSQIVVAKLDTSSTPLPPADENTFQPVNVVLKSSSEIFTEAMRKDSKVSLKVVGPVENGNQAGPGTLLVRGKVTRLDPGSQALRYWVGFGAGHSTAEVTGEVVDAQTNKPLLKFRHAKASGIGALGGDYASFMTDDLHDVGEDVGKMLLFFKPGAAAP